MKQTECKKCGKLFSNSNIKRHEDACGNYNDKIVLVDENWKTTDGKYKCPLCYEDFSKYGISNHIKVSHYDVKRIMPEGHIAWNKGLTKETDERIQRHADVIKSRYKSGELISACKGTTLSQEHKDKVSKGMKKAHKEGRAWNIGMSRWNNEPSYPEKFFKKVIDNEFEDKNVTREYPVDIFSIDFAWVDKKIAIEIDGEQHQRFTDIIERDNRKNKKLEEEGWQLLRIQWKDMYNDTKKWIQIAKDFVQT